LAGFQAIPAEVLEAAVGMGLNRWQRWRQIQLPLALPIILAGVRVAVIASMGIATIGAKFGAGGLGTLLFDGIQQNRYDKLMIGSLVISVTALALNYGLQWLEQKLDYRSRL
jgi:osmoprotectant transport system permease protein